MSEFFGNTVHKNSNGDMRSKISMELANSSLKKDTDNHSERFRYVFQVTALKKIAAEYQHIYNQSIRARYNCEVISPNDVYNVFRYLEKIEKELCNHVA